MKKINNKILLVAILVIAVLCIVSALFFYSNKKTIDIHQKQSEVVENVTPEKTTLEKYPVILSNGKSFSLQIPEGYEITPVAEGLGKARFMAESPDSRLFVTDTYGSSDNTNGKIYILSNFNKETKRFENKMTYLSNLRNPNSIAFYKDTKDTYWLYVALTDKLVRYSYSPEDTAPTSDPEVITTFPDYGNSYKEGGWHLTRTIAFHNDKLYVSVGSSCDSCEEKVEEKTRASILEMNADGSDQKIYANGLRNAVGIKWVGDHLFATDMGVDHLGDDKPADLFYEIESGTNYGWPYCYEYEGKIYDDTTKEWGRKSVQCGNVPVSYAAFDVHSAPLGFEHFNNDGGILKNSFLVALHGSGKVSIGNGYSIVRINQNSPTQDVVAGFLQNGERVGRPVDILNKGNGSFFFTDDYAGVVYYVFKK